MSLPTRIVTRAEIAEWQTLRTIASLGKADARMKARILELDKKIKANHVGDLQ